MAEPLHILTLQISYGYFVGVIFLVCSVFLLLLDPSLCLQRASTTVLRNCLLCGDLWKLLVCIHWVSCLSFLVPYVLKSCAEFIETHGIVDGIYRLSGVTSNIQKLR